MFDFRQLKSSFFYALRGLKLVFKEEQNFRIQIYIAFLVIFLAIIFKVKIWEAVVLILVIVSVLVLELINSIFDRLTDFLKPRLHGYVGIIKDLMSGAVLLASIGAVMVGIFIFLPHFINFFKRFLK